jgi:hypothetical protein
MRKDYFMKNVKKEAYKELKLYYRNISILYDLFSKDQLTENDDAILGYIKDMPISEIEKMYAYLIDRTDRLDIMECYLNPVIFKYMVIEYIQELRHIEE